MHFEHMVGWEREVKSLYRLIDLSQPAISSLRCRKTSCCWIGLHFYYLNPNMLLWFCHSHLLDWLSILIQAWWSYGSANCRDCAAKWARAPSDPEHPLWQHEGELISLCWGTSLGRTWYSTPLLFPLAVSSVSWSSSALLSSSTSWRNNS